MAYGSNLTAFNFGDQMLSADQYRQLGEGVRQRDYQKKIADAMRKVSGDIKGKSTDELKSMLAELKNTRNEIAGSDDMNKTLEGEDKFFTKKNFKDMAGKAASVLGTPIPQQIMMDLPLFGGKSTPDVGRGSGGASGNSMRDYTPREARANTDLLEERSLYIPSPDYDGRQTRQPYGIYGGATSDGMRGYRPNVNLRSNRTEDRDKPLFGNMTNLNRGIGKWR